MFASPLRLVTAIVAGLLAALACWPLLTAIVEYQNRQRMFGLLSDTAQAAAQITTDTRQQLIALSRHLDLPRLPGGCPAQLHDTLQQHVLHLHGVRALVRVENNAITCSSASTTLTGTHLGHPTATRPGGVRSWHNVAIRPASKTPFLILESQQLGALLLPAEQFALIGDARIGMAIYEAGQSMDTSFHSVGVHQRWLPPPLANGEGQDGFTLRSIDPETGTLLLHHQPGSSQIRVLTTLARNQVDRDSQAEIHRLLPLLLLPGLAAGLLVLVLWQPRNTSSRELERALSGEGLFLLYQPVIDLNTDQIIGAEALLRWRNRDGKLLTPDLFIPMVESMGMAARLTEQVCQIVSHDLPDMLACVPDFRIGINISAQELSDMRLAHRMSQLRATLGLRPDQLVVELTESSLVQSELALPVIEAMRNDGIQIAIDDFGTGYCSLSYLATIPFDILKIDRAFVSAYGTDAVIGAIAEHVVTLCQAMQVNCLAEGIENQEQAQRFKQLGVQMAQGYYYAPPLTPTDLLALLRRPPV